jgi:hypothetical protein
MYTPLPAEHFAANNKNLLILLMQPITLHTLKQGMTCAVVSMQAD